MSNYKNLKKVIAVSSMAAATIGAGTMVNADNVHQQSGSSQKSSITAKPSSEAQNVKSGNTVVLKSSQSSKASSSARNVVSSSKASSSAKNVVSSSKASSSSVSAKQAQPVSFAAVQQGKMVNAVKASTSPLMNDYNKGINSSDSDLSYDANGAKIDYDSIMQIAKQYDEGDYANKSDLDYIVKDVANSLKEAKEGYDMSKTLSGIPNLQEKQQIYKDGYEAWNNLYNLLTKGEQVTPQPSSSSTSASTKKDTSKASSSQAKPSTTTNVSSASQAKSSSKQDSSSSSYPDGGTTAGPAKISDKQAAELQWAYGMDPLTDQPLKDESPAQQQKAKAYLDALKAGKSVDEAKKEATKSSNVKNSVKPVAKKAVVHKTAATVSSKKATKRTAVRSTKKASMPQTGEANNAGILAGIGALAIAAAGAFLFRKRG